MDIGIISLGVGLMLAVAGAAWKAASLKGDTNHKWGGRVGLAEAGLRAMAAQHLLKLHGQISQTLVQHGAFDPTKVVADPTVMASTAEDFLRTVRVLKRLSRHLRILRRIGPVFLFLLGVLEVALVPTFGHLGKVWTNLDLYRVAGVTCLACAGLLVLLFVLYAYLQHKLSDAEILAAP